MLQQNRQTINLQGEWRVAIDPQDSGTTEKWFNRRLAASGVWAGHQQFSAYANQQPVPA